jgi:3-methylfumaryl-CoA hydratase
VARAEADWSRIVRPDPILLFRYSALTYNGHRIHYDRPYAVNQELYPGLIVHGPLLATLLLDLAQTKISGARIAAFRFRAQRPVFDSAPFSVCGKRESDTLVLWIANDQGELCMSATARLS